MAGTAQTLITAIVEELTPAMASIGWNVQVARGEMSAIECLYRQGNQGLAVVKWRGASVQAQSRDALVCRHRFSVVLSARRPLGQDSLGTLDGDPADSRLLEAVDAARATVRRTAIPLAIRASAQDIAPQFTGDTPLTIPDGWPTDAVEQSWEAVCADGNLPEPSSGSDLEQQQEAGEQQ